MKSQNRALHNCTVVFRLISDQSKEKPADILVNAQKPNEKQYFIDKKTMVKLYIEKKPSKPEEEKKFEEIIELPKTSDFPKEIVKHKEDNDEWETVNDSEKEVDELIDVLDNKEVKKIGEVVYIIKNDYENRDIIGKIENTSDFTDRNQNKYPEKKINYVFVPNDRRLPKMFIKEIKDDPYDKINAHEIKLDNAYFVGHLLKWPNFSFYPHIEITSYLGLAGEIENECKALLLENRVYIEPFTEETHQHLAIYENNEWVIPEEERLKRWDLTKTLICTIDPLTARDLDDALSIEKVTDGIYEIGVHIADVSHFVKENDPVDDEARKRTTSVYLPHRVIPMLPGILCEKLCSLNPGVERLAFSIFFKINENGEWLKDEAPRIGKSIMKSCGKLSYEVAQMVIEGKIKSLDEFPEVCKVEKEVDGEKLMNGILKMNEIAKKRREKRMKNGSLQFEKRKRRFQLNEQNIPISYTIEEVFNDNIRVLSLLKY